MRTVVTLVALLAFACAPFLLSQQPPKPPDAPPVHQALPAPASGAPTVSNEEHLEIENLQLRMALLRDQEAQLNQQFGTLIERIQAAHPGYVWSPQTNGLVRSPQPGKAAAR